MLSQLELCKAQLLHYPCGGFTAIDGHFQLELRDIMQVTDHLDFALVLRPLNGIETEDAKAVVQLLGYDRDTFNRVIPDIGIETWDGRAGKDCITWNSLNYRAYMYLVSKQYDVPLWIETGHIDNGKTMIELELAVIKPQFNSNDRAAAKAFDDDIRTAFRMMERKRLKEKLKNIDKNEDFPYMPGDPHW